MQVAREFVAWTPSIIYALGVVDNLFLDFYWEVPPSFDEKVFLDTFVKLVDATNVHTDLPPCY